MTTVIRKM